MTDGVSVLGVRHHGPGSARSVRRALEQLEPDIVLIEGPPDAQNVAAFAALPAMQPPVAIVVYRPDRPGIGTFYPFAVFSPEWNALRFALERGTPVRFCDLPQAIELAQRERAEDPAEAELGDPIRLLSEAAGEPDPERWWERLVEQRVDDTDVFRAINEAMAAVRETITRLPVREARREAHMRQSIRQARRAGFRNIAVVCGAWHAPALESMPAAKTDEALLRGLKRVKVAATWVPWTASRLMYASGYGAGIESPAWYRHQWETRGDVRVWLTRAARLLREHDLDGSPAQVVDAVRLAEALSALRNRPRPTLSEVTDATLSVLCNGDLERLGLVRAKLIVGEELGELPDEVPAVPLQRDLEDEARRLRLRFQAEERTLDLDLRQPAHLAQSQLLHRLRLLGIDWGRLQPPPIGLLGTFHELWALRWRPAMALQVIEAGVYGNTVATAASTKAFERGSATTDLAQLTALVETVLLADLADAIPRLVALLEDRAAATSDVGQMLEALSPLASTLRYGDVRKTDAAALAHVLWALAERAIAGLAPASTGLDADAAATFARDLESATRALSTLHRADVLDDWWTAVAQVADHDRTAPLVAGTCTRLLLRADRIRPDDVGNRMSRALAPGVESPVAAAWVEGFLRASGLVLATSPRVFSILDAWLSNLPGEYFIQVLPLLRRTTSTFAEGERRQIAERVTGGAARQITALDDIDLVRAALVEPTLRRILGVDQ